MRVIILVLNLDFGETIKCLTISCNLAEEHCFRTYPICLFTIESLARNAPQLLPTSKSGCSLSMMERISFNASLGCKGKSGVSTTAIPSKTSLIAFAIGQLPVAKNPCRNSIFFIVYSSMFCFGVCSALFFIGPE